MQGGFTGGRDPHGIGLQLLQRGGPVTKFGTRHACLFQTLLGREPRRIIELLDDPELQASGLHHGAGCPFAGGSFSVCVWDVKGVCLGGRRRGKINSALREGSQIICTSKVCSRYSYCTRSHGSGFRSPDETPEASNAPGRREVQIVKP